MPVGKDIAGLCGLKLRAPTRVREESIPTTHLTEHRDLAFNLFLHIILFYCQIWTLWFCPILAAPNYCSSRQELSRQESFCCWVSRKTVGLLHSSVRKLFQLFRHIWKREHTLRSSDINLQSPYRCDNLPSSFQSVHRWENRASALPLANTALSRVSNVLCLSAQYKFSAIQHT